MLRFPSQTMATDCKMMVIILIVGLGPANFVESTTSGNERVDVILSMSGAERQVRFRRSSDSPSLPRYLPIYHLGISRMDVNDHHGNSRHPSTHDSSTPVKGTHPAALLHHAKRGGPHAHPASAEEKPLVRSKRLKRSTSPASAEDNQHPTSVFMQPVSSALGSNRKDTSVGPLRRGNSSSNMIADHSVRVQNVDHGRMGNDSYRIKSGNRDPSRIHTRRKGVSGDRDSGARSELIETIKSLRKGRYKDRGQGGHQHNQRTRSKTEMDAVKFRQRQRQPIKFKTDGLLTSVVGRFHEDAVQFNSDLHRAKNRLKGGQTHSGLAVMRQSSKTNPKIAEPVLAVGRPGQRVLRLTTSQKAITGSKTQDAAGTGESRGLSGHRRQKSRGLINPTMTSHKVSDISDYRFPSQSRRRQHRPTSAAAATRVFSAAPSGVHERNNASPKTAVKVHHLLTDQEIGKVPTGQTMATLKRQRRDDRWKPATVVQYRKRRNSGLFKSNHKINSLHHLPSRPKRSPETGRSFIEKMELVKREQQAVHRRLAALNKMRPDRKII